MATFQFICIECPIGCDLIAEQIGADISVTGNGCKRGELYAKNEIVSPKRIITTTMRTEDGKIVAVKTDNPVNCKDIFTYINMIKSVKACKDCKIGDILISNIDVNVNVVATSNPY